MEPAIIILKFAVRSASKAWAHGAPWALPTHTVRTRLVNGIIKTFAVRTCRPLKIDYASAARTSGVNNFELTVLLKVGVYDDIL